MGDQHRFAEARGDRRGGVADMDYERAAADRGAVDLFRGEAQIMRDVAGKQGRRSDDDAFRLQHKPRYHAPSTTPA